MTAYAASPVNALACGLGIWCLIVFVAWTFMHASEEGDEDAVLAERVPAWDWPTSAPLSDELLSLEGALKHAAEPRFYRAAGHVHTTGAHRRGAA